MLRDAARYSSKRSTTTATPCGTSSRVFRRICSRTNSATKKRSGWSLRASSSEERRALGEELAQLGEQARRCRRRAGAQWGRWRRRRGPWRDPRAPGGGAALSFTLSTLLMTRRRRHRPPGRSPSILEVRRAHLGLGLGRHGGDEDDRVGFARGLARDLRSCARRAGSRAVEPGVSTKTYELRRPRRSPRHDAQDLVARRLRVRLVMAIGSPRSALRSVLLPTFGPPDDGDAPARRIAPVRGWARVMRRVFGTAS